MIARVYSVSPKEGERYYLRLLLHNVPGATSFEHLRTVGNNVCDTFKDACSLLGLLEEDVEWTRCMDEAALWQMPCQLRQLFVILLVHCHPQDVKALWEKFKNPMSEDFKRDYLNNPEIIETLALMHINRLLEDSNQSLSTHYALQLP